jgi:Relaxase/Mobilisation nuclease domain
MIGKILIGKSFRGCISYCLEDKLEKIVTGQAVKDRAEVLSYNLCYGDKLELIKQFNEVRNLNPKLSKPVMHVTLSLALGEQLHKGKLSGIVEDCAKEMGFDKNQFIVITHNDTTHQHLHIVVNRVGFDGKTLSDSNNYKTIANYCRKMEQKHNLRQVLNPKKFLPKEMQQIERVDSRKEKLRLHIRNCLSTSGNYRNFELQIKQCGYQVIKARGIAFIDAQKVRTKGSEVGYSLSAIEKILGMQPTQKTDTLWVGKSKQEAGENKEEELVKIIDKTQHIDQQKQKSILHNLLLKPTPQQENMQSLLPKKRKKKKKSQHL